MNFPWEIYARAEREAVASQLPGRQDGPADAYRHILAAAEAVRQGYPESVVRAWGNGEKETIRLTVQQWINTTMMSGLVSARMLDHGRKSWSELGRPCRMVRQIQQILILHLGDRLANGTGIQRMMPLRTRTTGYRQRKQIGHHAGRLKVYRHLMIQTGGGSFLFREPSPKNAPLMIWTVTGYQIALNHSSSRLSEIFSTAPKTGSGPATPSSSTSTATV